MQPTFKELLTEELVEDGKPLFPSAAAVGDAIISQESSSYRNARSIGTLIGFMFRGKRACPVALREVILKAVRARLGKQAKKIQDDWVQRVGRTLDLLNSEVSDAQAARSESDEEQFISLLERANVAKKHFIITPLTAEQVSGNKRAEELNNRLLTQLGISPCSEAPPLTKYCFLLPDEITGRRFWDRLRDEALLAQGNLSAVLNRLKSLHDNGDLQVFIVPPYVCGCPIVVYDPEDTKDRAAFSFTNHRDNIIDAIRWDDVAIYQWYENVYVRFHKTETEEEAIKYMAKMPGHFAGYHYYPF